MLVRRVVKGIADYATLRRRVRETLLLGQERIEREKVLTYWKTTKRFIFRSRQGERKVLREQT